MREKICCITSKFLVMLRRNSKIEEYQKTYGKKKMKENWQK